MSKFLRRKLHDEPVNTYEDIPNGEVAIAGELLDYEVVVEDLSLIRVEKLVESFVLTWHLVALAESESAFEKVEYRPQPLLAVDDGVNRLPGLRRCRSLEKE